MKNKLSTIEENLVLTGYSNNLTSDEITDKIIDMREFDIKSENPILSKMTKVQQWIIPIKQKT